MDGESSAVGDNAANTESLTSIMLSIPSIFAFVFSNVDDLSTLQKSEDGTQQPPHRCFTSDILTNSFYLVGIMRKVEGRDDDNFMCSFASFTRLVSWLGSRTEHVIAFMSSLCVGHQRVEKAIKENTFNALLLSDSGKASDVHRIASASAKRPTHPNVDPEVFQMRHQHCARNGEKDMRASRLINQKRRNQMINGIMVEGNWITNPCLIKDAFLQFYKRKFQAQDSQVMFSNLPHSHSLNCMDRETLERQVTLEEIKEAVWDCGSSKAPGPDGYSFAFVKKYWGTIQKDLYDFVNLFFASCVMPNGANSSFFTLIPKVNNPTLITDFRPISLIGIHYKIIAKILANRLSKVIDKIVSKEQSAFIAGRQILDGPVILSEIIEWYKKRKKKLLIFKVDFEKAFDSISWNYLIHILDSFGFGNKWCSWIKACLNSSRASILINGSPTSEFSIKRGLRQGDPLSPFLFILVMEGLHNAFEEAVGNGLITGVNIKNSTINVSHLFYADDVIITTDWNAKDMDNIIRVLHVFYLASGLKINIHKSNIYGIGVNKDEVLSMASNAGCIAGDIPFNYLGLPIGSNMKSIASWKTLVDRFHMRLSSWKANLLSIGGRLTLIKSVLGSLGIYYLSIFRAPESVLQDLERIRANFFWGGNKDKNKMAWVKWPIILNSFDKGGLNIGSLKAFNLALLQKWRWRLLSSPNALWVQVIKAYHGQEGGFDTNGCSFKGIWANIVGTSNFLHSKGIILSNTFRFKAGCGTRIRFWKDIWVGETPLFTRYNRLYHLDQDKDCLIIDRINNGQWSWNWSRTNLGVRNLAYLCDMLNEIGQLNIDVNEDTCTWSLGPNGTFTVKDARYRIDQNILPTLAHATTWDKSIPRKVNVFMWRLSLDRLPHRLNLSSRGMDIPAISCPSCNANVESANHVFFECDIATDMWKLVFRWCDIPLFQASSWDSFNDWIISWHASKEKKHRFYVITTSVLWWLWRYRNSVTFNSQPLRKSDLFDNVRFSSFSWLHNRDHMKLSWNDWLMLGLRDKDVFTRLGERKRSVHSRLGLDVAPRHRHASRKRSTSRLAENPSRRRKDARELIRSYATCSSERQQEIEEEWDAGDRASRRSRTWNEELYHSENDHDQGGHWKSNKHRPNYEDDLSQPWLCEETYLFTARIQNFKVPKRTRMPVNVKTYDDTGDPDDHLKIF
ncbi:RNA-directed DNA polymerase, eukaryota, reverse transcriptase zinc-binding domain protein [Tanacetum coccineum]